MNNIKVKETEIPIHIMDKWQSIVDIMADILSAPSAIITRVDPPEIEILQSAQIPDNPYIRQLQMRLLPFDNDLRHRIQVPYDPEYPSIFKKVADYVESELPSVKLIHIGSTAIYGISGKPMIDAAAITQADLRKIQHEFIRIGFFRRDVWTDLDEKPYVCASTEHGQNRYNFNIHICKTGDSNHKDFVAFRDSCHLRTRA